VAVLINNPALMAVAAVRRVVAGVFPEVALEQAIPVVVL
jgi:hypothetical protein